MRKLGIAVAVIIVLVIGIILALPFILDVNQYRGRVQAELESRTGRSVSLGKMDLKIFPLAFRVENAVIGEDPAFRSVQPFAQMGELLVSTKLMPLLSGKVEVDSLELRKPKIELIRDAQGVWNFSTLGKPASTRAQKPAPSAQPSPQQSAQQPSQPAASGEKFSLAELNVVDGQLAVTDFQKRQPRAVYDHIDLDLRDYAPGKPVSLEVAAHLPGTGKETIRLKGKGGPIQGGDLAAADFAGELKLEQVSLAGLQKFLNAAALENVEFVASGTTDISNKNGVLSSKGNLTLADGRVHGVTIGYPISADYNISVDQKNNAINIQKAQLKLGATPLAISGIVNAGPTPAQLDLKVNASDASIAEFARLASAFGVAFNPGMQIAGKLDADISARGSSKSPALNGGLAVRELVITGKDLPQAVHVTAVNLSLSPNTVKSNDFVATTGSTAVKANFALNNYSGNASAVDANVGADNAQLGELINIAKAYGVSGVEDFNGTGPVSINVHVQGPTKNPGALVYSGSGKLQNNSLTVPAFTKPIQVRNADLRFTQNGVVAENLAFSLGSTNASGQMTLKGLAPNATPETQFAFNFDKFIATEWQAMMRNQPVPASKAGDRWTIVPSAHAQQKPAQPKPTPTLLSRMVGTGNVQIGNIIYDQLQLTNAKSGVTLDRGVIKLAPLTAQLFGGTQAGSVVIDMRSTPSTYAISSKLDHVDANQLLSSISSVKKTLYGLLAANANTTFASSGSSEVARTLNGKVNVNLQNGKLAGIDLLNQLAEIGKFAQGKKTSEPFTNIAKLTGDFNINNGVATTENLNALIDGGTMAARGAVNLVDQSLNMQLTAVLSKEYSQSVGGSQVGGYLTTALANNKGELVMPVTVTGTFASPHVAPDYNKIAQMKLQNILPTSGNPGILGTLTGGTSATGGKKSGVSGILDALGGKNQQQQNPPQGTNQPQTDQQQNNQQKSNPVTDIMNSVLGGNKKKTPPPPPPPPPKQDEQPPPK